MSRSRATPVVESSRVPTFHPVSSPAYRIELDSKLGRCVIATRRIEHSELIAVDPVIILSSEDGWQVRKTILNLYTFSWWDIDKSASTIGDESCLALGVGSLFNHSDTPNVQWLPEYAKKQMSFRACKNIMRDEQMFLNYGYRPVANDIALQRLQSPTL